MLCTLVASSVLLQAPVPDWDTLRNRIQAAYAAIKTYKDHGEIYWTDAKRKRIPIDHGWFSFDYQAPDSFHYLSHEVIHNHTDRTFNVDSIGSWKVMDIPGIDTAPLHELSIPVRIYSVPGSDRYPGTYPVQIALDADLSGPFEILAPILLGHGFESVLTAKQDSYLPQIGQESVGKVRCIRVKLGTVISHTVAWLWFDEKTMLLVKVQVGDEVGLFHPVIKH